YLCAVRQADHRVLYSFTRRSSDLHAEILHFEIILDAVFRALAAVAAFLHAAERRHFGRDDALVDADDAVFQRLRHAPHAPDVPRAEAHTSALQSRGYLVCPPLLEQ